MAQTFLRNTHSGDEFDLFFVSAVSSLLAVRLYLSLSGFPEIGHGGVHVAHMLFGGLFMLAGLILLLGYVGQRVQRVAAVVGGIGFGIFIDELGKFVTQDNNYFFQPTIAIIYAIFVGLFLLFRALRSQRGYTPREYLLGALLQLEEVALQDMDASEQERLKFLLSNADPTNPLTSHLKQLVAILPTAPAAAPSRFGNLDLAAWYHRSIGKLAVQRGIQVVLLGNAAYIVLEAIWGLFSGDLSLLIGFGQLTAGVVAGWLMIQGVRQLATNRVRAYELVNRGVLINIFITQFFSFYHQEFRALPGFILNLLIFAAVSYGLREERTRAAA